MFSQQYTDKDGNNLISTQITTIPASSICDEYEIQTYTVKSCNENGIVIKEKRAQNTPDDHTYQCYPELQTIVPRCFSQITFKNEYYNGQKSFIIRGMPKFSADNVNEEDEGINSPALLKNKSKATHAIITDKANGKTFIVRALMYNGKKYWFGGSKNVHRIYAFDQLVELPISSQTNLHQEMFHFFFKEIRRTKNVDQQLFDYLLNNNLSACAEYVDGKHIVFTEKPYINWFGFTNNEPDKQNLCMNIINSLRLFQEFGLTPVGSKQYIPDSNHDLRIGKNTEGFVLHWLDESNNTVAMEKLKTYWYVIIRMLREIMLSHEVRQTLVQRIRDTLFARNNSFMHLPSNCLKKWFDMCCAFAQWFITSEYKIKKLNCSHQNNIGMAHMWQQFLNETNYDDSFVNHSPRNDESSISKEQFTFDLTWPRKKAWGLIIFTQGIPGLGKNYIGELVCKELATHGISCSVVDQDQFDDLSKKTQKDSRSLCRAHIHKLMENRSVKVILVQRNNATHSQYQDISKSANILGWKTLLLQAKDHQNPIFFITCAQTVLSRKGHALDNQTPEKKLEIVKSFWKDLHSQKTGKYIDEIDKMCWMKPYYEIASTVSEWFNEARQFETSKLLQHLTSLSLNTNMMYRRSETDLVNQYYQIILKHLPLEEPEPVYVSLDVTNPDDRSFLINQASSCVGEKEKKKFSFFCSHVTLMHSNHSEINAGHWKSVLNFYAKHKHQSFVVHVVDMVVVPDGVVYRVDLSQEVYSLVCSKHPHITGLIVNGKSASHSINILSENKFDQVIPIDKYLNCVLTAH